MKELLIPVGNMETLNIAIHSGADAVYLGGKKFGARAFANNFDDEEMIIAIKLCHLYGVKIYVTVNTLIYESELESAFNYLKFLHINGVDAVIVQDLGLIHMARKYLPNLEIHASTQVHNTNQDGINYLYSLGVKRVVFARELSIDEINNINTPMEKEAFIHGALCVSYSGQCLFSSLLLNRSGNRGECAQVCRLPYKLMEDEKYVLTKGEYLLSTKELNSSNNFLDILKSDVYSLKVEGRMKSSEYVGCVTKLYRDLLDKYYRNEEVIPNREILNDLSTIFNREYTKGFINSEDSNNLMNIKSSNHIGTHLGKVIKVDKKYIYIKLDDDLNQEDGIRFTKFSEGMICNYIYDSKGKLISHGKKDDLILLDNKVKTNIDDEVRKTLDKKLINKYNNVELKKIPINIKFKTKLNDQLYLIVSDGINSVEKHYGTSESAINNPISQDRIVKQLSKLGNTPFIANNIEVNIDKNLFINIKDINEIRRMCIDELIHIRENSKKDVIIKDIFDDNIDLSYNNKINISVLVRNEEQMKAALECNVDRIYVENKLLFNNYKDNKNILFRTSRVGDKTTEYLLSTELGAINRLESSISDYYLNIANHESINLISKRANIITLSVELPIDEIRNIMNYFKNKINVEYIVYSNIELMLMKYCPLKLLVNKDKICNVCSNNKKYFLVDRFNKKYRLLQDTSKHLTHIMNYKPINNFENVSELKSLGVNNFRIELLDENYETSLELINKLKY